MLATMIYAVNNIEHLQQINLKYLVSGHSYLECDSMHSAIENKKRDRKIYSTDQLKVIKKDVRVTPGSYTVHQMNYTEFYNMKKLAHFMKNYRLDTQFENIQWLKLKWIQVNKNAKTVRFKYDYEGEFPEFHYGMKVVKPRTLAVGGHRKRSMFAAGIKPSDVSQLQLQRLMKNSKFQRPKTRSVKTHQTGYYSITML